jgi:hypothetical protein
MSNKTLYTIKYINGMMESYDCCSDDDCRAHEPGKTIPWSGDPQDVRKSCLTLQATDEMGAKALRIYIEPELTGYEDLQEGNSHPPPPPESAKTKKGWNAVLKIVGLAEDDFADDLET